MNQKTTIQKIAVIICILLKHSFSKPNTLDLFFDPQLDILESKMDFLYTKINQAQVLEAEVDRYKSIFFEGNTLRLKTQLDQKYDGFLMLKQSPLKMKGIDKYSNRIALFYNKRTLSVYDLSGFKVTGLKLNYDLIAIAHNNPTGKRSQVIYVLAPGNIVYAYSLKIDRKQQKGDQLSLKMIREVSVLSKNDLSRFPNSFYFSEHKFKDIQVQQTKSKTYFLLTDLKNNF